MIEPEDLIVRFADRIPAGKPAPEVLDVACGAGRHSLFLARRGCRVVAMDRHLEHLRSLRDAVRKEHLPVEVLESNVESMSLLPERFDAIVNTLFLWRPLLPQFVSALRPGGVIYFRTFTTDHTDVLCHSHPRRDFQLQRGELRRAFDALDVIHYEESVRDDRAVATLVAMRGGL